jgi:hypothetical protein
MAPQRIRRRTEDDDDDEKPAEKDKTASDRPTPLTYYFDGSPLAQTIAAARQKAGGTVRLAVVGLGSGTLACQTRPGDKLTYYEIDPLVVRIARDPDRFGFLTFCAPEAQIVLGDARLTLADAGDGATHHHRRCILVGCDSDPSLGLGAGQRPHP